MKKHPSLLLMFFMLVPASSTLAQDPFSLSAKAKKGLQHSDLPAFLEAAKEVPLGADDVAVAVSAAGKTNDPFWIPHLKPFLKYARNRNTGLAALADAAQLALAKLGEHEQLQQIACEAEFGSPSVRDQVVNWKLQYVQGWVSISVLTAWIEEDHVFSALLTDHFGDVIYSRPQDLALKVLPEIVPNPPPYSSDPHLDDWIAQSDDQKLMAVRRAWREWIRENASSLRRLNPVDDGIDLSESTCKLVLSHDKHIDHSLMRVSQLDKDPAANTANAK